MQNNLLFYARQFFNGIQNFCYTPKTTPYNAYATGYCCQPVAGKFELEGIPQNRYPLAARMVLSPAVYAEPLPYVGKVHDKDADIWHYLALTDSAGFLAYLLRQVSLPAYQDLCEAIKPSQNQQMLEQWPAPHHYVACSTELHTASPYWQLIGKNQHLDMSKIQAGDILAWTCDHNAALDGHVVVVANPPTLNQTGGYVLEVYDAAPTPHDRDTRLPLQSGVGKGFITLMPTNVFPFWRFRWRQDLPFTLPKHLVGWRVNV